MSQIQYYLMGGAGINIGAGLKEYSRTRVNSDAGMVGFDTSDKNFTAAFPIEQLEGVNGSGKDSTKHYDKLLPFVAANLKKHRPGVHNIIVASTAGGTGRVMAMIALRLLVESGKNVILCLISEHTSLVDKENAVNALRSFANQCQPNQLNRPVCYMEFLNTPNLTRKEVNLQAIDSLNLLSLLFDPGNTEIDEEDIKRFFNYSAGGKTRPALSRIHFYDQDGATDYTGKVPVSVASLYPNNDDVVPRFMGSVYRTTGIFSPNSDRPEDIKELHVTLDHGEALEELEKEIEGLETVQAQAAVDFSQQKDISEGSNDLGFML